MYTATGVYDAINSYLRGGKDELTKAVRRARERLAEKRKSLSNNEIKKRLLTEFEVELGI